ncbi:MAG: YfhO family protein, partial [Armatimonadetes bacterium]|nr:YfhO family protein [Armatimonadota bacterium]NIM23787.1 YfhO family protein [Armatimonadota bacterium]NIM67664.1 YfhO family protein [Armatimonadota bacterium]NIM76180.1 YfhO family protein [Armatimonadota bacterium]NIN05865.1 YfhO family protein [Armatimonadota bacterium]
MKGKRADLIAAALLLAVVLAFCGRAIFTGRALLPLDMLLLMSPWKAHGPALAPALTGTEPGTVFMPHNPLLDPVQQYYPWRAFAVDSLKKGIIPLWNPFSFCGQPFLANLQSALTYPPNLIFLLLSLPAAFTWGVVLHLFLAGLFFYWLLREWKVSPPAALFGAIAFMLNGYIIGWLEYPAFGLWVLIWLPAILLFYEKAISTKRWGWAVLAGLAVTLQFRGGQLQISAYIILTLLLYVIWRAFSAGDKRAVIGHLGRVVVVLLIGLSLAAVQLLPTMELAPLSARAAKTYAEAREFAFPLTHLVLFFIPNFFGNQVDRNYWGDLTGNPHINFQESGCYVGVITLLLAWLALRLWRRPQVGFLLALTIVSVLLALGSPLFAVFYYLVPGAKQLAGLGRALCLADFGLAGLAAFGLNRLLSKEPLLARWELPTFAAGAVLVVSAALVLFGEVLQNNPPLLENFVRQGLRFLVLLTASLALVWLLARGKMMMQRRKKPSRPERPSYVIPSVVLALLIADLFSFGANLNPATDARLAFFPTEATDFLRANSQHARIVSYRPPDERPQAALEWMLPNTPLVYQLRDVHGYDSLVPGRYTRLIGSTDWSAQGEWPAPDSALADLLGIKYALTTAELEAPGWKLERVLEESVYYNEEALPRAFVVNHARRVSDDECLKMVQSGTYDYRREVLLSGSGGEEPTV